MPLDVVLGPESSSASTSLINPPAEHKACRLPGLMNEEAKAELRKSANHTSMARAMSWRWFLNGMPQLCQT
jgi:hypothetical protein